MIGWGGMMWDGVGWDEGASEHPPPLGHQPGVPVSLPTPRQDTDPPQGRAPCPQALLGLYH